MGGVERRTAIFNTKYPGPGQGFPGVWVEPPFAAGISNLTVTANRAYYLRWVPEEALTVTKISVYVSTLDGANPNSEAAIYNSAGTKVASSGAVAGVVNNTGVRTASLTSSYTVVPGDVYYIGFSTASAAVAVIQTHTLNMAALGQTFGGAIPNIMFGIEAAAQPLPNTMTLVAGANNEWPLMCVRTD